MPELLIKLEVFLKRDESAFKAMFYTILQSKSGKFSKRKFYGECQGISRYFDTIRHIVSIVDRGSYRDKIRFSPTLPPTGTKKTGPSDGAN